MLVGDILKRVRVEKGLTIRELAARTGLSVGFLSNVERDINSPTISSLAKICEALETSLVNLFQDNEQKEQIVVRKSEREILVKSKKSKTVYELLTSRPRKLRPVCITMEPGGDYGASPMGHEGEEFGIVLEGKMEITVGNETYLMEAGDSVYVNSFVPHKYRNAGTNKCISLWVSQGKS
ncbi:cupin domain-containing protein [Candidatus Formimonas warabiya]|uniref:HTH cro/C1-type domain-containing protein n=1 Tax=Formimonas warabiya TaxID=1761012 RepID=A0A3G1KX43_FORW1|nr:cupin domain-containing protein [Candidatus Formimonas warabiya]ATW27026.1 hypothetical protein DCMF_21690 [Candidatus Formimonas warabiya]